MFFDGGCPMCQREVAHYQTMDRRQRVSWIDISEKPAMLEEYGIGLEAAMKRLHAIDERGRVVSGAAAFVCVWRQLPAYRHVAWLVERLGIVPLLDRIYVRFAAWRYRRRCEENTCSSGF
jgi:predicted DCC family thiol-disulfide oxidoreductase YuxK